MKVFKIRDANGLYSTGGTEPEFTQGGKVWNNIGHVKSHLRQFVDRTCKYLEVYVNAEVVTIEYTEKEMSSESVLDVVENLNKEDISRAEKSKQSWNTKDLEEVRDAIGYIKYKRDKNEI
jgi:hypothetical protein